MSRKVNNNMHRNMFFVFALSTFLLIIGCAPQNSEDFGEYPTDMTDVPTTEQMEQEVMSEPLGAQAMAKVHDVQDQHIGTVLFQEVEDKVNIHANFRDLEPGYHGYHIHEQGICDPESKEGPFMSAGGHYTPNNDTDHAHHPGDMPALYVNEDGTANVIVTMDRFTPAQLIEDQVSLIVHAEPDNLGHIPERYQSTEQDEPGPDEQTLATGDAGERIACGEIVSASEEEF